MTQLRNKKSKFLFLSFSIAYCVLRIAFVCFAQQSDDLEFTLDVSAHTIDLPTVFRPNIDLSGRGFYRDATWPQGLAAKEVLDIWQKEVGFAGLYRLQYNLWEIQQFVKNRDLEDSLLRNYENIIKNINDAGGVVILNIFGTPAGLGGVLDKRSFPKEMKDFKALVKSHIRRLSCQRRYNIWYEVWNAPDLDEFFLGRKQEYFMLYRQVAEAARELEAEYKIHIPVGGPGVSWWFQNLNGNTVITPEESLIYELIKFCYRNRLPLNFITWHAFSSDPKSEEQTTLYNKPSVKLIREWLSYFRFAQDTHLIIDEWNYDRGVNVTAGRGQDAYISSSYIPARLKNMQEAGLDYQLYFSLEDFQNNKEGVVRNIGIFWFDPSSFEYKGGPKSSYNVFNMLGRLGKNMFLFSDKFKDEFVGMIATRDKDYISLLIYNYIDPDLAINYISRTVGNLSGAERKAVLGLIKSEQLNKIMLGQLDIAHLRLSHRTKALLKKVKELNDKAEKFKTSPRNLRLDIKNLKENYLYQRYAVNSSCNKDCPFAPIEEKEVGASDLYQEVLSLSPYSVHLIVLKRKPKEEALALPASEIQPPSNMTVHAESGTPTHPLASGVTAGNATENK